MNSNILFNPCLYGKISYSEAAQNNCPYVRNVPNPELREYVKKKFNIPHDDFHFEEGNKDELLVINSRNEVVNQLK